jgi:hypothetical protein
MQIPGYSLTWKYGKISPEWSLSEGFRINPWARKGLVRQLIRKALIKEAF